MPNHHLFRLAEQAPADMVALLRMISSLPPVVKSKAKELLEVIKNAGQVSDPVEQEKATAMAVSDSSAESSIPQSMTETERKEGVSPDDILWSAGLSSCCLSRYP